MRAYSAAHPAAYQHTPYSPQPIYGTKPARTAPHFGPQRGSYVTANGQVPVKQAVVDNLKGIQKRFLALRQSNWLTGIGDDVYDEAVLPALVMAENARTPRLKLTLLPKGQDLGQWVRQRRSSPNCPSSERLMFSLPPLHMHYLAADIRHKNGKTSIIALEPGGLDRDHYDDTWRTEYLPALKEQLGDDVNLSVLSLDTQIFGADCRIFALSHASKMADNRKLFDMFHRANIAGYPLITARGALARQMLADGNIRIMEGAGLLPPVFAKHAQSEKTVRNWVGKGSERIDFVNKAGETLLMRHRNRQVERFRKPLETESALRKGETPEVKSAMTSPSIEDKRLVYLQRAINYFEKAGDAEAFQALSSMHNFPIESAGDLARTSDNWSREWGPRPGNLLYSASFPSW
jgi:hypothetical protein